MESRQTRIKRLILRLKSIVRSSRILKYSCKFSKKIYTQHQLLLLLILKLKSKKDYREFMEEVAFNNDLYQLLELHGLPHFTTLIKFLKRFDTNLFDRILLQIVYTVEIEEINVGIDGTGFSSSYSSKYLVMRINRISSYKNFMKLSVAVDTNKQLILCMKSRKSPSNDNKDFIPLLKKLPPVQVNNVMADKGYDCEVNHRFIRDELNAEPLIPVKKNIAGCHNNKLRKRMKRRFESDPACLKSYHQRSKVETVFSVMKRKFGDVLFSRKTEIKKKELKMRAIIYNVYRITQDENPYVLEVFIKAL